MNHPDVIWLWPTDNAWHATGLEIDGDTRYVRQPQPKTLADHDRIAERKHDNQCAASDPYKLHPCDCADRRLNGTL